MDKIDLNRIQLLSESKWAYGLMNKFKKTYSLNLTNSQVKLMMYSSAIDIYCYLKEHRPEICEYNEKLLKFFHTCWRNYLCDKRKIRINGISDLDLYSLIDTRKESRVFIIRNPAIIDALKKIRSKNTKYNFSKLYKTFGPEILRLIRNVRIKVGGNMKVAITRMEYEYLIRKANGEVNIEKYLAETPDMSKTLRQKVQLWISTGRDILENPNDCFGFGFDEKDEQCTKECDAQKECKEACSIFVKSKEIKIEEATMADNKVVESFTIVLKAGKTFQILNRRNRGEIIYDDPSLAIEVPRGTGEVYRVFIKKTGLEKYTPYFEKLQAAAISTKTYKGNEKSFDFDKIQKIQEVLPELNI